MSEGKIINIMRWVGLPIISLLSLVSCRNNHCDDLMYAPTNVLFYSEVDTSVAAQPMFLMIQGVGADSVIDVTWKSSVELLLDNKNERCSFAFAVITQNSKTDTLSFMGEQCRISGPDLDVTYPSFEEKNGSYFFDGLKCVRLLGAPLSDTSFLCLRPDMDTLEFEYDNSIDFVSAECGCVVNHHIKNVKFIHNGIGSVIVTDSTVTNLSDAKNVKIYLENY